MRIYVISWLVLLQIIDFGIAARKVFVCTSGEDDSVRPRSFLLSRKLQWPGGVVPYELDPNFSTDQVLLIEDIFHLFENVSCVKWVPRAGQKDYVAITHVKKKGVCSSCVGRKGGRQSLYLGDDCFDVDHGFQGAILHEMMHTLGFIHEQQRLDRNCFVKVYSRASLSKPYDFAFTLDTSTSFPYDFGSIMHYGTSENLKAWGKEELGNLSGELTKIDVMKLNNMYCGGETYCEINPIDCQRIKEIEKICRFIPRDERYFVTHRYNG